MKPSEFEGAIIATLEAAWPTGIGPREVASKVGCTPARVYQWMKRPQNITRYLVVGRTTTNGQLIAIPPGDHDMPGVRRTFDGRTREVSASARWIETGSMRCDAGTIRWLVNEATHERLAVLSGDSVTDLVAGLTSTH